MDSLIELGLFSGKVLILVFGIGLLLMLVAALILKARKSQPSLSVENLNRKFESMAQALKSKVWDAKLFKAEEKALKKKRKGEKGKDKKRIYVLDFVGDIRATHVDNLREEITTILTVVRPTTDEVVVRVESPGGMVNAYGLAATQLVRLRSAGVPLTICIDKVAASGGYMMACTANKVVSAQFAIIGSIGVVAQVPNVHRLLKKYDIDYEDMTAGDFKRTVSVLGEITEKGRAKFIEQLEDTHLLFKQFIKVYRPQLDMAKVATGEYWFGERALELKLVDELSSSDDYLFRQRNDADIYKLEVLAKKKWSEKFAENISALIVSALERTWLRTHEKQFPS